MLAREPNELLAHEERVERDRFGERHAENGLDEDFDGRARIASNAFDGFGADEAHAYGGGETAESALDAAGDFSEYWDHVCVCFWLETRTSARVARSRRKVGIWSVCLVMFIAVIADQADVNADEKSEHECLHKSDQKFEEVEGNGQNPRRDRRHRVEQIFTAKHITEQPEGERNRAEDDRDYFD